MIWGPKAANHQSGEASVEYRYRICGCHVATDIELPGAVPVTPDATPDIVLKRGELPAALPDGVPLGPNWQIAGDRVLVQIPGRLRFLVTGGKTVVYAPENGRSDQDFHIFLCGTALGVLFHQRGGYVVHASAVEVSGKAMLFCGPSEAGKSTLAAALANAGHPFLSDDICVLDVLAGGQATLRPDGRMIKLWSNVIAHLNMEGGAAVRAGLSKLWVQPPQTCVPDEVPLGAIYVLLGDRRQTRWEIDRLSPMKALNALRSNAYRPRMIKATGAERQWFAASSALLRRVPIFGLSRPDDLGLLSEALPVLEGHWRSLNL